jgi:hypothetical protein
MFKRKIQVGIKMEEDVYLQFKGKVHSEGKKVWFVIQDLIKQYMEENK